MAKQYCGINMFTKYESYLRCLFSECAENVIPFAFLSMYAKDIHFFQHTFKSLCKVVRTCTRAEEDHVLLLVMGREKIDEVVELLVALTNLQ